MSAGRGWIAVVAVMPGRNNPLYAAAACVLFGFADATRVNLQSLGLPNQLTDIAPYVATLAALVISHRRRTRAARPAMDVAAATPSEVVDGAAGEALTGDGDGGTRVRRLGPTVRWK